MAKAPASTVQILGAEKALFRALKTKGNTPKYGLIYHSTFIGRADAKNKGRISRYLANKCSIATRIDSFTEGEPTRLYGEKLRDQVEERLRFYETGASPRRNIDVMEEISRQLKAGKKDDDDDDDDDQPEEKSAKKKKTAAAQPKPDDDDDDDEDGDVDMEDAELEEKKKTGKKENKEKKKKRKSHESAATAATQDEEESPKKKKAKKEEKKKKKKEDKKKKKKKKDD